MADGERMNLGGAALVQRRYGESLLRGKVAPATTPVASYTITERAGALPDNLFGAQFTETSVACKSVTISPLEGGDGSNRV
jgi:hypothetical protein